MENLPFTPDSGIGAFIRTLPFISVCQSYCCSVPKSMFNITFMTVALLFYISVSLHSISTTRAADNRFPAVRALPRRVSFCLVKFHLFNRYSIRFFNDLRHSRTHLQHLMKQAAAPQVSLRTQFLLQGIVAVL